MSTTSTTSTRHMVAARDREPSATPGISHCRCAKPASANNRVSTSLVSARIP
ncbi:hypothetical protein K1Y78_51175 [Streptomyces sp. tea 10]|nr:hypothetical protein [Streptomyces sp. tea 10]